MVPFEVHQSAAIGVGLPIDLQIADFAQTQGVKLVAGVSRSALPDGEPGGLLHGAKVTVVADVTQRRVVHARRPSRGADLRVVAG